MMDSPVYDAKETHKHETSFLDSIRSSRLHDHDDANTAVGQSLERYTSLTSQYTTLEALVCVLSWIGLPGPAVLSGPLQYIGSGSQFIVYKQTLHETDSSKNPFHREVAAKQPKFPLDSNSKVNLAEPKIRQHLQHMLLEILAFRHPKLRAHPNIANLIGWSSDTQAFYQPVFLLMELADHNLATYLKSHAADISLLSKYWIFHDIASGLDAIHDLKLIHGDLKPGNILLYHERGRLVAKLADFGLSVEESACQEKELGLAGTLGWQAPEVESGRMLKLDELPRTDNYSFGLLVWSTLLHSGKAPPNSVEESRQVMASREIQDSLIALDLKSYSCLPRVVFDLLHDLNQRPSRVEELFDGKMDDECASGEPPLSADIVERRNGLASSRSHKINMKRFTFERRLLSSSFAVSLFSRFQQNPKDISGDLLFAMFLAYTRTSHGATVPQTAVLDVLIASALQGYEPAQAVVLTASEFFESELPPNVKAHIPEWLERGVASGSIISGTRLKQSNPTAFCTSRAKFRALGGYNWIYCTINLSADHLSAAWGKGYTKLHWLATYGAAEDLLEYLESEDFSINSMTENEETPLYLACARGSWEIVRVLLEHGACPLTKCTSFKISCMHWLFSFEMEFQAAAATALIHCGADINGVVSYEVPFLHYPFVLPPGSPLHWAVATSSHETISVLIQAGANVLLRNGVDPYVFDHRVRDLNKFDGPDQQLYSIAEIATKGLTPLDLSAMQHDPFIFNSLLKISNNIDINVADEEGFSVLHRLSSNPQGRTRSGGAFSTLAFRGSKKIAKENLKCTIAAIKALGGNLEQLTTPSAPQAQRTQGGWQGAKLSKCTPIMLAFLNPSLEVMQALLEAGASVHTENNLGQTAIHCLPYQNPDSSGECARLLISYGANVNHKDSLGAAPILRAAQYSLIEVVEAMLCAGADIDERLCKVNAHRDGTNIFAFLARFNGDDWDISVARLLQQYVFSHPDVEKRRRVVDVGDREGETLLHCFAFGGLPRCVEALLNHGAPVNASHKRLSYAYESTSTWVKSVWHETPLDVAVESRALKESRMSQYREWSVQTYTQILQTYNAIISMLEKSGGLSTRALVVKSSYVYEGPAGGLMDFLRDGL